MTDKVFELGERATMKYVLVFVCLITSAIGVLGATQYRDFTSTDGKTIKAVVKAYDAQKKTVTIERDNRKTAKVSITVFSEADQIYIREWEVLRSFSIEHLFKISAKRKRVDNETAGSSDYNSRVEVEDTSYEIVLDNRSGVMMDGLELEYCIYYEQESIKSSGQVCDQGVYCGKLSVASTASKSKVALQTEAVSTYIEEMDSNWSYIDDDGNPIKAKNVQRGDVHGIWIRVHLKLPSGERGMREYCLPDSLNNSKVWKTSSIRAGLNRLESP